MDPEYIRNGAGDLCGSVSKRDDLSRQTHGELGSASIRPPCPMKKSFPDANQRELYYMRYEVVEEPGSLS